ncbi:MAG: hypothetical protein CMJ18_08380 [Phycisphaeraceae bacterium]|nr:hypothetical protein [Phycisphaeraceae bacterium]
MKIIDVSTVLLTGPNSNDPFVQKQRTVRSAAFIEIHTDSDLVGIGETYTGYHAPEIVPAIVDFFKPILVGLDEAAIDPRELWERMYYCANFWSRVGVGVNVLAGIEGALWDLRGKMEGRAVHELLGPLAHERLPCYATGCSTPKPWSQFRHKLDIYREAGFNAMKVATGWMNEEDGSSFWADDPQAWIDVETEKLEIARDHAGSDFVMCLDAHMSNDGARYGAEWDAETATRVLAALEPYNLFFFEEPLNYNDVDGYAAVSGATAVPVAGGEGLTTVGEFERYARRGAPDIAQPDAAYMGTTALIEIARLYGEQGKRIATHAWSAGAGVMQNIHASFVCPNTAILEIPPLGGPLHTEVWADGFRFENGEILPPQAPGLGVRLTDEIKNRFPFEPHSGEWNPVPGGKGEPR